MHIKSVVLYSTSMVLLAGLAPAAAQTSPAPPAAPVTPAPSATETTPTPAGTDPAAPTQTADAGEVAGEDSDDMIVVTGLRQSLRSAQGIKRNSAQIVDVIVAQDIGKLPDLNVSDSLARITGVQVDRSNGEAGRIRVRGLPDLTTTYNGREIFTAEVRNVATQDFPAGTVAALEVFKSTTAEQVEGGLAGIVNVRSRRPFDFEGLAINGSLNGTYADQSGSIDYNGNLLVSNRWETGAGEIGALVNVSYTQLNYLDSARFNSGFIGTANPGQSTAGAFRFPDAVGIFYGEGKRWRPSINAALQWKPTPELEFYAEGLFQGFRREVTDRRLFVPLFGDTRFTNVVLQPGGNQARSLTAANAVAPFLFQGATREQTDTYQYAIGGVYTGERFKISVDLARTNTRFEQSVFSFDTFFTRNPTFDVNFDVDREAGGVEFAFQNFDTRDPANYGFGGLFDRNLVATGEDVQFRLDVEYDTGLELIPKFAAGVRLVDRDSGFDLGQDFRGPPAFTPLSAVGLDLEVFRSGFRGSDVQPTRDWITPTYRSLRDNVADIRGLVGFANPEGPRPNNPNDRFRAEEKSFAGYGQLSYAFDLGSLRVDGVAGVRAIITDTRFEGAVTESYTNVLPNVSMRLRFTDELSLRGAYTQTRTRPNFDQIRPSLVGPVQGNLQTITGGNPDLRPLQSDNYDLSLEYYFSDTGFAAVSAFRRDFTGFIFNQRTVRLTDPNDPGSVRIETTLPVNGEASRLEGVEAQLTTFFDFEFVPQFLRRFGVQANYTYLTGEQNVPGFIAGAPSFQSEFANVSRHTYNLVGLYETEQLSARLTYNYRSKFFTGFDDAQSGVFSGEFTDPVSRLDFSASYTPVEYITIAFDVSNILGAPFRNFRNYTNAGDTYPRDVRYEERIYSIGLRFRL